ncbi:MAG: phosphomannomutase/phosphoglucomutase [Candidatus Paceibacterota bacterium]|jgi:phosphomannomutase/phosphoglucomutase
MMKINQNIFRSYDIRGIYPSELNEEAVYEIVKAFCFLHPYAKKIALARDSRLSSPYLADSATKAFLEEGREVMDLGIAPDPLFYFSIMHYGFGGGMMISGSHNPKEYNGLTLNVRKPGGLQAQDLIGKDLSAIKDIIIGGGVRSQNGVHQGKSLEFNPAQAYIDYVTSKVKLAKPLKIIFDSGNGACGYLPERVFKALGCEVETLFAEFDGTFPNHSPDPYVAENRKAIEEAVLAKGADLGFMYDSDGDRVAIIDNRGRAVDGDLSLLILGNQALQKKVGPVVHCMRASKAFIDEMEKQGAKTYFSISHHNAVIDKILETGAVFGGEITFHFLFPLDYYLCDDAVFASLEFAQAASQHEDFAGYVDSLPRYFVSPEIFLASNDNEKFKIIQNLQKYLRDNNYNFIDIDGARINFEHGWALARASNTTPIIKCRFEGDTEENLKAIEKEALDIFQKVGLPINEQVYQQLGLASL